MAGKKPGPRLDPKNKTGNLRPKDQTRAETVPCPNIGYGPAHGASCPLCHGTDKIKAIK